MRIKDELNARAKFKINDKVYWHAVAYTIWHRYWRRSTDEFLYDLREIHIPGQTPDMPKKVREEELQAV